MKSVLVTCGATVSFPALIETVLNRPVIGKLKNLGYTRLVVQYGRGFESSFLQLVEKHVGEFSEKSRLGIDVLDNAKNTRVVLAEGVEICGFEYLHDIETLIAKHIDLVISHAGTGSILDALRLEKKLIVVVNDTLMDNHQQLIADKFAHQRLLWSIHADTQQLLNALDKSENEVSEKIGNTYNKQFEKLLYNVAIN
ncbi:unnamed protein product [Kluyveromyces dobzhanskii CBS 2104]|uniref:UDP-N-acetylglucosamine transferase subunit ALG13 n=1 Tax=Kluyveromyces dobzhanskii CBS 2104 TaxID=1427455 RepID=A0A0A8LB11_9SACH|nr:unnamed protein product [Kluyveromyces dobzhanskii CBS 2104]